MLLSPEVIEACKKIDITLNQCGNTIDTAIAAITECLIDRYSVKSFETDTYVVTVEFSAKGGTFSINKLRDISSIGKETIDFKLCDKAFKVLNGDQTAFMIEPKNYGDVEPYTRCSPYYFYGYRLLTKIEKPDFNLFTLKKRDYLAREHKWLNKFSYNNIWNTVSFDMLTDESKLYEFIENFMALYGMECMTEDIISYLKDPIIEKFEEEVNV